MAESRAMTGQEASWTIRSDLSDVDLAGDHLVPEPGHDLSEQLEPVTALVRDQDAQVGDLGLRQNPWS